ncbi:hypothetical protein F5Y17DRAFT_460726 [Xylariaceae sp. FL0594]|nr:hypothetical protein F5Y17DRAFT_460726 [Xylariaceae sp. FL0594]
MSQATAPQNQSPGGQGQAHPAYQPERRTTCLSVENHDCHIMDNIGHYFGCIRIDQREDFFTDKNKLWEEEKLYRIQIGATNEDAQKAIHGSAENIPTYKLERDISVPIIEFKDHGAHTNDQDPRIKGAFPNQKTTIQRLLSDWNRADEDELLYGGHDTKPGCFKYFHIPSNNMIWIERAIAKYFGEAVPDLTAMREFRRPEETKTSTLLRERYWRGQLHGDSHSPAHARYMSPMCETISSSADTRETEPRNITVFMPYLHWETSRKREQFASEIEDIRLQQAKKKAKDECDERITRILKNNPKLTPEQVKPKERTGTWTSFKSMKYMEDVVEALHVDKKETSSGPFSMVKPRNHLARYLLAAAELFEAMTTYRDKALLRKYLPLDPPIHPRRTLDQSFYWTLRSTKRRDKDQVVYRGTTAKPNDFHRYDTKLETLPCHQDMVETRRGCGTCKDAIRKVSRVVMVDQLWMWVLDEKTIITAFPKRYGANKQDYSGIHKSIRTRLESLSPCSIRTVFEMAIIILDECTKTFFDQAKSPDRQPQVIDEFSKAIGNIMLKQTLATRRLWHWTGEARRMYLSESYLDITNLHTALLDINPEGKLEREVDDIIEELDMMLHVSNTHQEIIKRFIEHAAHILNPNRDPGNEMLELNFEAFKQKADECQERLDSHVKELEALRRSAKNAAEAVQHLLDMKQQQASLVQAWQAVKQSEESIKQSRSIMVFTLATIVFLPLSFLSSVFGMNNKQFGGNTWDVGDQFLYIFLLSLGVIFISLLFAYSAFVRAKVWSVATCYCVAFLVKTGIYELCLRHAKKSAVIHKETQESYQKLTDAVKEKIDRDNAERREAEAKAKAEQEAQNNLKRVVIGSSPDTLPLPYRAVKAVREKAARAARRAATGTGGGAAANGPDAGNGVSHPEGSMPAPPATFGGGRPRVRKSNTTKL